MDCQDWNTITFNNISKDKEKEERKKIHSNKTNNDPEKVRLEAPKELGKFQGDTTDIERVGVIISMEYDLANDKIKELEDETNEEQKKITALAIQMKEYLNKKK